MSSHKEVAVPLKINKISVEIFFKEFTAAVEDDAISVVVLVGGDEYFSMGMDLEFVVESIDENFVNRFKLIAKLIANSPKPVIAKVEGNVIAGGVIFLGLSDYVICGSMVSMSLPEASFGLAPTIVMASLYNRVTAAEIKKMVWGSKPVLADKAKDIGLVDLVCKTEELSALVERVAFELGRAPGTVVRDTRKIFQKFDNVDNNIDDACDEFWKSIRTPHNIKKARQFLEDIRLFNEEYSEN